MLGGAIGVKAMVFPALDGTASALGPFARILLNAQVALLIQYEYVPASNSDDVNLPEHDKFYHVVHINAGGEFTPSDERIPLNKKACTLLDFDDFNREVDHEMTPKANVIKTE